MKEGDIIGRILLIEFQEKDYAIFNEVMEVLKHCPEFENVSLNDETVISIPGLTIYPEQRKIYRDRQEVFLMKCHGVTGNWRANWKEPGRNPEVKIAFRQGEGDPDCAEEKAEEWGVVVKLEEDLRNSGLLRKVDEYNLLYFLGCKK